MSEIGIKIIIIAAAIAIGIGARWLPNAQEKLVVEKAAEEVVKDEAGFDVNLEK